MDEWADASVVAEWKRVAPSMGVVSFACSVVVMVLAQWALAFAGGFSLLLPFVLLGAVALCVTQERWLSLCVILLTSPLSVFFAMGALAYGRDDAFMASGGQRDGDRTFIDRQTRLPMASSGCLIDGDEWVFQAPHDSALRLLSAVAGPPPGTYLGPIPTEEEARRAVEDAATLDWRELASDHVHVDGRRIALQRWLGPASIDAAYRFDPRVEEPPSYFEHDSPIRARIWRGRVLLIAFASPIQDMDMRSHVMVVDAASGRVFGNFPGQLLLRSFPRAWQPIRPRPAPQRRAPLEPTKHPSG